MSRAIDAASEYELQTTENLVNSVRAKVSPYVPTFHNCRYCGEPTDLKAFCNLDCRNDYDSEQRIKNNQRGTKW